MSDQTIGSVPAMAASGGSLDARLKTITRRLHLVRAVRYGSVGLLIGSVAGLLLVGLGKLRLMAEPDASLLAGVVVSCLAVSVLVALARRITLLDAARITEQRADLKERLSSAVEFRQQGVDATQPFYAEQFSDAALHAEQADLRRLYPVRLTRTFWAGIGTTLALVLATFLPTLPMFWSPQQRAEVEAVKTQGMNIVKIARDTEKEAEKKNLEETRKAAKEAKKLGEAMRKNKISRKQALVETQKLTQKIEQQQKKLAAANSPKSIEQARGQFKKSLEEMNRELARAQQAKTTEAKTAEATKKDPKSLQNASLNKPQDANKPSAQNPTLQNADNMSLQQMQQMQQTFEQMDKAMAANSPQEMQKTLEQLSQQIQSGQFDKQQMAQMAKMMDKLSKALQNTNMDAASKKLAELARAMQEALNKLDKETLKKLAEMMKQASQCAGDCPNPNALAQMDAKALEELLKALKEGRFQLGMGGIPIPLPGNKPGLPIATVPGNNKGKGNGIGVGHSPDEMTQYLKKVAKNPPNTKVTGKRSAPSLDPTITLSGDPEPTRSNAPYFQVYQQTRRTAEGTLKKENIPAAYKEQVRDYFKSIRP